MEVSTPGSLLIPTRASVLPPNNSALPFPRTSWERFSLFIDGRENTTERRRIEEAVTKPRRSGHVGSS
jgi:hypothetical protein